MAWIESVFRDAVVKNVVRTVDRNSFFTLTLKDRPFIAVQYLQRYLENRALGPVFCYNLDTKTLIISCASTFVSYPHGTSRQDQFVAIRGVFWVYGKLREFYPRCPTASPRLPWNDILSSATIPAELADKFVGIPYSILHDWLRQLAETETFPPARPTMNGSGKENSRKDSRMTAVGMGDKKR